LNLQYPKLTTSITFSEGNPTKLGELQQDYRDEYNALTTEEKDELVAEFNAHKEAGFKIRRPTARARIQDVANVSRNMQMLVSNLNLNWRPLTKPFYLWFVDDGLNVSCWGRGFFLYRTKLS
jgi:hypothetical protein